MIAAFLGAGVGVQITGLCYINIMQYYFLASRNKKIEQKRIPALNHWTILIFIYNILTYILEIVQALLKILPVPAGFRRFFHGKA